MGKNNTLEYWVRKLEKRMKDPNVLKSVMKGTAKRVVDKANSKYNHLAKIGLKNLPMIYGLTEEQLMDENNSELRKTLIGLSLPDPYNVFRFSEKTGFIFYNGKPIEAVRKPRFHKSVIIYLKNPLYKNGTEIQTWSKVAASHGRGLKDNKVDFNEEITDPGTLERQSIVNGYAVLNSADNMTFFTSFDGPIGLPENDYHIMKANATLFKEISGANHINVRGIPIGIEEIEKEHPYLVDLINEMSVPIDKWATRKIKERIW